MSYTNEDQRHEAAQLQAGYGVKASDSRSAKVFTAEPMNYDEAQAMRKRVDAYLPSGYRAELHVGSRRAWEMTVWIFGEDYAGWTMEDYVVPRLASGLIAVEVVR